jgi:hypothetical protein
MYCCQLGCCNYSQPPQAAVGLRVCGQPHLHSPLLPLTGCAPRWAPHMQLCSCLPCTDANTRCWPCCVQAAIAVAASIGIASAAAAAAAAVRTEVPCTGTNPFLKAEGWPCCGPMVLLLLLPCSSLPSSVLLCLALSPAPRWMLRAGRVVAQLSPAHQLPSVTVCHLPSQLAAGRASSCNRAGCVHPLYLLQAGWTPATVSAICLHPLYLLQAGWTPATVSAAFTLSLLAAGR